MLFMTLANTHTFGGAKKTVLRGLHFKLPKNVPDDMTLMSLFIF